jgi:DNA-binding beta-propeller fold protein YncE
VIGGRGSPGLRHDGLWTPRPCRDASARTRISRASGSRVAAAALLLGGCTGAPIDTALVLVDCSPDDGVVCVVAGTGDAGFSGDGEDARVAMLYRPTDAAWRTGTSEYVIADWNNHRLRLVGADGRIATVLGNDFPGDGDPANTDRDPPGAPGLDVRLNHPVQAEWAPDGTLYLPAWHNHKVRIWDPTTGLVVVIAGDTTWDDGNGANAGYGGDGGPADEALLWFPNSLVFETTGEGWDGAYLFVDQRNLRVRRVGGDGVIDTLAGDGTWGASDATGDLRAARFAFVDDVTNPQPEPAGAIARDPASGVLYVADTWNHRVRALDPSTGTSWTVAGTGVAGFGGDGGPATDAAMRGPRDVELGPDGTLYVADTGNHAIRAVNPATGMIRTVLGTGAEGAGAHGDAAEGFALRTPFGLDVADDGALLVADTFNNRVLRVRP